MSFYKILMILYIFSFSLSHAQEYPHPNSQYNIALDHYQNRDFGKAMFYIKRAILLQPSSKEIRSLFYTIRKDIGLPALYSNEGFGSLLLSQIFGSFSPQHYTLIGIFLFMIGTLLSILLMLKKITSHQKTVKFSLCICFILSSILFIQASIQYYLFFLPDQRIVLETTKAYEEPSTNSTMLLELPAGTELKIIAYQDPFYLGQVVDGKEYWVDKKNIPYLWDEI